MGGLEVEQLDFGHIGLSQFPDLFPLGVHLTDTFFPLYGHQRVAVFQPDRVPDAFRLNRPDLLAVQVVLDNFPFAHVGNQQGAGRSHADVPELAVRSLDCRWNGDHFHRGAGGRVNDHRLGGVAVAHDQHSIIPDRLAGVDFGSPGSHVFPHQFFVGIDHSRTRHPRENDLAVFQQRRVVKLLSSPIRLANRNRIGPDHLATPHEEHGLVGLARIPLTGVQEIMLRQTLSRQLNRSRGGLRPHRTGEKSAATQANGQTESPKFSHGLSPCFRVKGVSSAF